MRELMIAALTVTSVTGCTADDAGSATPTDGGATSTRCVVRLHGKGGTGADDQVTDDGVVHVSPGGNADGWGGKQWLYFPDEEFAVARQIVVDAADDCAAVMINGFSNGAAFAAKLYCRGENLDGRLVRVVVDDPVPDAGVDGCDPDPTVDVTLYSTGALDATARPGWDCSEADWTCEGGTTIGIDAFAQALRTDVVDSVHDDHIWYWDAPDLSDWER